ncbi:putative integral membrane protein [Helicobacter mustelae 12198]|uniref:Putative integral membrane protein n=1 Tax=Helicobacter mustelae (strain ATCC 43772 / CCUG 25715 / CIP 103759 / LMG 18044 / NCTC 12198 / R85-136P) TaxID=679897 RepID=D3UJJ7_HELM1|nr:putative integral membrane protein [Helicobacter mustelae 12198]SQH72170.1 DedA family protein [Helicobacter mustelae]
MEAVQSFQEHLQSWGYLLLFLYSLGGGYLAIIAAGFLSSLGSMDITLSVLVAFVGNAIGSGIFAVLVRSQKKDFARYFQKHRRKVALAFLWLKKYGIGLIFFSKYIFGIKAIVPAVIGLSKYSLKKYWIFNTLACLLWALVMGLLSYFASELVKKLLEKLVFLPPYAMPLLLLGIGVLFVGALKYFSSKKMV